jgi:hypothetical protein
MDGGPFAPGGTWSSGRTEFGKQGRNVYICEAGGKKGGENKLHCNGGGASVGRKVREKCLLSKCSRPTDFVCYPETLYHTFVGNVFGK